MCLKNVCGMHVCMYNKTYMWGVCMYIETKIQFTNLYWLQIHPKKLHHDNLTNIYFFLLIIHGDSKYIGVNVHPISINHIIFKLEIITGFIKPT
jgi:hypothetical protein